MQLKLTGTPVTNHTVTFNVVNDPTTFTNLPSINATASMDRATLIDTDQPNRLWAANWNGAVTNTLFATFQFSSKQQTNGVGGTSTNILDSPFVSRGVAGGASPGRHYNAPYFDGNDPEDRNNRQFTGSVSSYVTSPAWGRHDFKVGGEHFTSWRTGGNSQSATGYVFQTDYLLGADGKPVLDSAGHPLPVWGGNAANPAAAATRVQNWLSVPGARLDIRTLSLYFQDRWTLNPRVTADAGLRYEDVKTHATGDIRGADTTTWLPRLGVSFDLEGNGRTIAQATYGRYSGRFTE
jgi:outer membrane receptor protein involved in Fe transport